MSHHVRDREKLKRTLDEIASPHSQPNSDSESNSPPSKKVMSHLPFSDGLEADPLVLQDDASETCVPLTQDASIACDDGGNKRRKVRLSNWRRKQERAIQTTQTIGREMNSDNLSQIITSTTERAIQPTKITNPNNSSKRKSNEITGNNTTRNQNTAACSSSYNMHTELERVGMFYCGTITRRPLPKNRIFPFFSNFVNILLHLRYLE